MSLSRPNLSITIALSFFLGMFLFAPIEKTFEYNPDEGINLAKADLHSQGYVLYRDIWNDQPPLFTLMLSSWFRLFERSVYGARLLVLVMSSMLVFSIHRIVSRTVDSGAALLAVVLLVFSHSYLRLSVSVMIGLPALAFGVMAVDQIIRNNDSQSRVHVIASSILMALSVLTKLFTALLIPLILIYLLSFEWRSFHRLQLLHRSRLVLWLVTFVSSVAILCLMLAPDIPGTLVTWHIGTAVRSAFDPIKVSNLTIFSMLTAEWPTVLLGTVAVRLALATRNRELLFAVIWAIVGTLILNYHRPLFFHHYLLVAVPFAWIGAVGAHFIAGRYKNGDKPVHTINCKAHNQGQGIFSLGLLCVALIMLKAPKELTDLGQPKPEDATSIVQLMSEHAWKTQWVLTDRPIVAFYAGLNVPPPLAVFSEKRIRAGELTQTELLRCIAEYKPEQVFIGRFDSFKESLATRLGPDYQLTTVDSTGKYILHRKLWDNSTRVRPAALNHIVVQ